MRIATTASIAILALSTAALAQVADPGMQTSNNTVSANASGPGNAAMSEPMDTADNMMDNSASPPPTEPK
jgi:hypothetical protein